MKNLIVANWKMNPVSQKEAEDLFDAIKKGIAAAFAKSSGEPTEVVICPPFVHIPILARLSSEALGVGGQNCFWEESGTYTGEISPAMLKDLGVKYVIVGHSERRKYFGETDGIVNKKLKAVLKAGLNPILCIGENAEQKEAGETESVLKTQLTGSLADISNFKFQISNLVVAYEPVWAISGGDPYKTKELPTPEKVAEANAHIRKLLADMHNAEFADTVRIIYGGSSNAKNAKEYLDVGVQGFLVGGASLKPDDFCQMVKSAE